ncbi:protein kinase [Isoptericola sp. S6320L]|uniref:protein kinase domain-containing protein n=1 Tax=Isoptericola sp. S6320L TaxID=2926411 RepID=UPI001FF5D212|nr:protein kinase [Isoptericola sp. S6320L]MCK0118562.1 protein kinase [Isoptericola sp. S6320L]
MSDTTPTGPTGGPADGRVVLGGRYVLGDILGTGGTYTVYEASRARTEDAPEAGADGGTDARTDAQPALVVKVLHPHLVDDEAARAAMAREIAASDLVDHPGVVKVLDTGEDEVAGANVPWLLTRRLPGVPLSELTAGDGLPWREALVLVDGLLDALGAVHAAGLVHRDVGPRNVVVDRNVDGDLTVGLLDLGLAAPGGGDGDGERVVGSVVGMSPEQARGRPLDARSDLYAAGALTYYALTGHAPFERPRPEDVLRAHVGAPVPAPSARRAAVPVTVDRFVARAMAKDPAQRFDSAEAMRAAAATLLGAGTASATDTTGSAETMTLGQIAADDPHRTAVVGAAGAAGAAAAAAAAATGDEGEIERTRQLGAVDVPPTPPTGVPATAVAAGVAADGAADGAADEAALAEEAENDAPNRRRTILVVALSLVLAAAVAGAAFWALRDTDAPGPVAPVTHSPSPTSSPTPSETPTTTAPLPPADPPDRSTPSADPTPTPSETPTDDATPTPSPTEEPSEEPSATPTSDPDPTAEPTSTPEPAPTDEPEPAPTDEPEPTAEPTAPGGSTGGGAGGGSTGGGAGGGSTGGDDANGGAEPTP